MPEKISKKLAKKVFHNPSNSFPQPPQESTFVRSPLLAKILKNPLKYFISASVLVFFTTFLILFYRETKSTVKIENYTKSLPISYKKSLEKQLRNTLRFNLNDNKFYIKGKIRNESYAQSTNSNVTTATFLVDIDDYKQTFSVALSWSEETEIPDGVLITCPPASDMKFLESSCKSAYDSSDLNEAIKNNPLYSSLPIVVDDFDFSSRSAIHYEIHGYFNSNNELIINIFDYSGGNHNSALEKLRSLGFSPENYKINYVEKFRPGE